MRGARFCSDLLRQLFGIIPAYAGSTMDDKIAGIEVGDHPRVCGEHVTKAIPKDVDTGSSPRMRGAPVGELRVRAADGIIPAYAGSTRLSLVVRRPRGDHPRVCGEHCSLVSAVSIGRGSSPRMRGARGEGGKGARLLGIIPAYAGSTNLKHLVGLDFGDHPRVCGEHKYKGEFLYKVKGSSPRMRGAPTITEAGFYRAGIIPAYAGSTGTP